MNGLNDMSNRQFNKHVNWLRKEVSITSWSRTRIWYETWRGENCPVWKVKQWAALKPGSYWMNPELLCPTHKRWNIIFMHGTAFSNSFLLPESDLAHQISPQAASEALYNDLCRFISNPEAAQLPSIQEGAPPAFSLWPWNSSCILSDKQVIHRNWQEEFILGLPLQKQTRIDKQSHQCKFLSISFFFSFNFKTSSLGHRKAKETGHSEKLHTNNPGCQTTVKLGGADGKERSHGTEEGARLHSGILTPPTCFPPPQTSCVRIENPSPSCVRMEKPRPRTISGPRWLSKAFLDLAGCSSTWRRLPHTLPSRREAQGRTWATHSQGCSLCLCYLRESHGWWSRDPSRGHEIHFLVTRELLSSLHQEAGFTSKAINLGGGGVPKSGRWGGSSGCRIWSLQVACIANL